MKPTVPCAYPSLERLLSLLLPLNSRASQVAQLIKNLPVMRETQVPSLGQEDPLEEEMATHSSILARGIPGTEESGGKNPWGHKEWDTTEHEHTCEFHMPKSYHPLQMMTAAMKLKDACSLEEKDLAVTKKNYDKPRQHIKK